MECRSNAHWIVCVRFLEHTNAQWDYSHCVHTLLLKVHKLSRVWNKNGISIVKLFVISCLQKLTLVAKHSPKPGGTQLVDK